MKQIAVIGAGRIGSAIADLLSLGGDYAVTLIDRDQATLDRAEAGQRGARPITRLAVDLGAGDGLAGLLAGKFALLSAAPFHLTTHVATAAVTGRGALSRPDRGRAQHPHGASAGDAAAATGHVVGDLLEDVDLPARVVEEDAGHQTTERAAGDERVSCHRP